ncbi:endolytic transglycosylase MltG [bacterium endosymbiont of Escarpia laminata]|nr:MAG: endolytic transglycosylase MltG [bacterium endosymbiont of Escarpia laminata]RLJ21830.1 MAG: endolytic transglycosylase MltG [bacterium endosymbiont of Escarpia laminata]
MLQKLFGILIFVLSILCAWGWMEYEDFMEKPLHLPAEGVRYNLEPGTTMRRLSAELAQQGLLERPLFLRLLARWNHQADQLKVGEYHIPEGTRPEGVLRILTSGKVVQYALTVVEGWTFKQMMAALNRHEAIKQTLTELPDGEIMRRIGHPEQHPEGRFYPDTYHFPRGTTDVAFLKRAYRQMEKVLAREWEAKDSGLPLKSPYECLILASIVERETGLPSERPLIAGVFIRRLQKGMRLQTDPTVIYGMGDNYDGNIRRRDLKTDTPYNTYVHAGLTPTPIAMPSGEAIHAALHPTAGKALYFVATGGGGHYFSATLAEHNKAVRKYQLKR